jgi:hypothetical protein
VTFIQTMIFRSLSETGISSIPRVIGPPASLAPDEKYAWDPSSLISPIYNPTDGGHQTTSTDEPNTQRASQSPPADAVSPSRTNELDVSTTFYPTYLTRPLRPLDHGLLTGEPNLLSIRIAHSSSNVPGLLFYYSANVGTLWAGEDWEAVKYPQTPDSSPPSVSNFGQKLKVSNPPLANEWNRLMQQGPYTSP